MVLADISPGDLNVLIAFGGGVVSVLSPCVLPIIPGYLSLVTGLSVGEVTAGRRQDLHRIAVSTGAFVAGFTVVFVALGLVSSALGQTVLRNQEMLTRVAGVIVILMAVYLAGSQLVRAPMVYREVRFHPHLERFGPLTAPIAGAAFGLAWTPCIGPVLGAVLTVAADSGSVARGTALLVAYSAGMGASFLAIGLGFGRLTGVLGWVRRHSRAVTLASAAVLGAFGVILVTESLPRVTAELTEVLRAAGLDRLVEIG